MAGQFVKPFESAVVDGAEPFVDVGEEEERVGSATVLVQQDSLVAVLLHHTLEDHILDMMGEKESNLERLEHAQRARPTRSRGLQVFRQKKEVEDGRLLQIAGGPLADERGAVRQREMNVGVVQPADHQCQTTARSAVAETQPSEHRNRSAVSFPDTRQTFDIV